MKSMEKMPMRRLLKLAALLALAVVYVRCNPALSLSSASDCTQSAGTRATAAGAGCARP